MPELPEVQTIVNELNSAGLAGRTIEGADISWPRSIAAPDSRQFGPAIVGERIASIARRGKYIHLGLISGMHLLIHLRMSGRLNLVTRDQPRQPHEHVVLHLEGGLDLRLHDTRKFARVTLLDDPGPILDRLGPEPLDPAFTAGVLGARLLAHRRMLKPLLLDQGCIAGLGNIYVDEALWQAGLHPCRNSSSLARDEIGRLHQAIPLVLQCGLDNLGTTLGTGQGNFYSVARRPGRNSDCLQVFRRTGQPCPRCATPIVRLVVGQRSTHICPACQVPHSRPADGT